VKTIQSATLESRLERDRREQKGRDKQQQARKQQQGRCTRQAGAGKARRGRHTEHRCTTPHACRWCKPANICLAALALSADAAKRVVRVNVEFTQRCRSVVAAHVCVCVRARVRVRTLLFHVLDHVHAPMKHDGVSCDRACCKSQKAVSCGTNPCNSSPCPPCSCHATAPERTTRTHTHTHTHTHTYTYPAHSQ